ncbi:MAG TPA: DUF6314 family protein [Streptosporangiaceae bacterium]|nr:DUF6314 family protein [Streptosporangiaceae bacterium]
MPELAVTTVFERLPGRWDLDRTISGGGTVLGQAEFSARMPGVLRYRETGSLSLSSGYVGKVYREYFYCLEEDHIHVSFADAAPGERSFLRLRPVAGDLGGELRAGDTHHCGSDVYEATFSFESARRILTTIQVTGPKKDYLIRTVLTRQG